MSSMIITDRPSPIQISTFKKYLTPIRKLQNQNKRRPLREDPFTSPNGVILGYKTSVIYNRRSTNDEKHKYQLGIVSFGSRRCGIGVPGVYTNVAAYMDWIQENLEP